MGGFFFGDGWHGMCMGVRCSASVVRVCDVSSREGTATSSVPSLCLCVLFVCLFLCLMGLISVFYARAAVSWMVDGWMA